LGPRPGSRPEPIPRLPIGGPRDSLVVSLSSGSEGEPCALEHPGGSPRAIWHGRLQARKLSTFVASCYTHAGLVETGSIFTDRRSASRHGSLPRPAGTSLVDSKDPANRAGGTSRSFVSGQRPFSESRAS